jgi:hypothetical protein
MSCVEGGSTRLAVHFDSAAPPPTGVIGQRKMTRKCILVLSAILLCLSSYSPAQNWSGVLDPSRAIDWSKAGAGTIPKRTTICASIAPYGTSTSPASPSTINNAIASCPEGQVVALGAGTFYLSSGIIFDGKNNITLRGAGADQTSVVFYGGANCNGLGGDICIKGSNNDVTSNPNHTANWTSGYAPGSTSITLDSVSGLNVGSTILSLDQLNDLYGSDTGGAFVCDFGPGGVGTVGSTAYCADEGPSGAGRPNRSQQQLVQVTGITGSGPFTVNITPGLYMPNWRSSQGPGAFWAFTNVTGDGIEDLSLDHTNSTFSPTGGIFLYGTYRCWVKGIRSMRAQRNHIWVYQSIHDTIRDSYFYGTQSAASQSYGIETYMTSDNLIENNIFQSVTTPSQANGSSSGNVIGHNFMIDMHYTASLIFMQASNNAHSAGIDFVLHEGNQGNQFEADIVHGTHQFLTAFRNVFTGWEPAKQSSTDAVLLFNHSRFFNLVGNVLGTPGYHNNYQYAVPTPTGSYDTAIYVLGIGGNNTAADNNTPSTLMRWGNYDTVTKTVRFAATEVPSTISQFANPLPASQTLPVSFYLSAKPSWWGVTPFPAIGPDVTGGSGPGGHSFPNPAQVCYNNTTKDSNGILIFNGNLCYWGPAAPTKLSVIVQ